VENRSKPPGLELIAQVEGEWILRTHVQRVVIVAPWDGSHASPPRRRKSAALQCPPDPVWLEVGFACQGLTKLGCKSRVETVLGEGTEPDEDGTDAAAPGLLELEPGLQLCRLDETEPD
jgi:hypothetical protein